MSGMTIIRDALGAIPLAGRGDHGEAFDRGRAHRLAVAVITSLLSAYWVGPVSALIWALLVVIHEVFILPALMRRLAAVRSPKRKGRLGAALSFAAACLYTAGWAPAYFTGAEGAGYFAGLWIASSVVHALVYAYRNKLTFAAQLAPPLVAALVGVALHHDWSVLTLVLVAATARLMLTTFIALRDRHALLASARAQAEMRKAAEETSEQKSRFLATVSHELRTPLTAVIGFAEVLEDDMRAEGKPGAAADAARIHRAARQLLGLINEVLDLSKLEAGRMELKLSPVRIPGMVASVVEMTAHISKANGNTVRVQIDPTLGVLMLDAGKARQCLLNLVTNACKFTRDGTIEINAGLEHRPDGDRLRLVVADTGIGIATEEAERLFQPYAQIAQKDGGSKQAGTGLGLVITRQLARLMGGDVTLESADGRGSRFTLTMSATPAHAALHADASPPASRTAA